ncbi:hypothetical protein AN0402.2 [Aspergillus nidulans FGSC A4]|uniref:Conidiation-specific protein 13 n=1 Tax=Emericella nidulans (strain FGSC A4 / ATCC 38163 / CBS 112.46 / NRRL 194 / M139) TaxID=227321 RepID=Q5BGC8_EMENI|nr:hypothetical protein [Aspergillus nidulans FGSC A4]EAA66501.1 hypothetical protein AN0402.2 [Aspergillus nidulans FGSC A4]CBF89557.1 TPA: hypothetical protein ANIA_00402 [Aspergillus nidulans FGSC A4]|eukprot:XP_658006.1 hypothetical protein AN0402.2 [Aspergillus nidulans FGSC A4]
MRGIFTFSAASALFLTLARAELDKPALTSDLDYLLEGNANNLPTVNSHIAVWPSGYIPKDCQDLGSGEGYNASDFEVYEVTYDDCADPWLFCRHRDVEVDIATAAETFSKLPVKVRDWVRQILLMPGANSAFAINGNVAFFGTTGSNVDVMIHESAHGLDGFAAFGENLSSSDGFLAAYDADTHVPDNYARSSQAENVAQNTVVAVYDKNVPGGFPGVQEQYTAILNQYSYIQDKAGDALVPGGTCDRHLENSEIVVLSSAANTTVSRARRGMAARWKVPQTEFKGEYSNVVKEFVPFRFKEEF